ncbi:MAG: PH domain-containing protein [bacterium]|nr:PH domain-containing protein [bacterium]
MYCNKCGAENPADAAFCKKCGGQLHDEEETRVRVADERGRPQVQALDGSETDERIFAINPTVKFVALGYLAAVVAAFVLVVLLTVLVPGFVPLIGVVIGLLLLLVPVYFHVQAKLIRYALTDTTIEIDRGLVSRTTQHIPLRRVQDVTVTSSIFQRMLGYGDITIDNASEDGGKVVLDNIDMPKKYADMILRQMRSLDR